MTLVFLNLLLLLTGFILDTDLLKNVLFWCCAQSSETHIFLKLVPRVEASASVDPIY